MEDDGITGSGVPASPSGSQASPEAAKASSPSVSIPNAETPSWVWRDQLIGLILDRQEEENAGRPDFTPSIDRQTLERAIAQLMGCYDCRPSDTAAGYAWMGLWDILRVDFRSLQFLPASGIAARSDETLAAASDISRAPNDPTDGGFRDA